MTDLLIERKKIITDFFVTTKRHLCDNTFRHNKFILKMSYIFCFKSSFFVSTVTLIMKVTVYSEYIRIKTIGCSCGG